MLLIFRIAAFFLISGVLYFISRSSLRSMHSHGFYRFFAWEAFLALMLMNLDIRQYQPDSAHHLVAICCLTLSGILAIHGFQLLRRDGKLNNQRDDPTLLWVEKTTVLVTKGAYKYIRHPLYCSFFLLTWGSFFFVPSWPGGLLAVVVSVNVIVAAKVEEKENLQYFGEAYSDYVRQTKMFIPFVL